MVKKTIQVSCFFVFSDLNCIIKTTNYFTELDFSNMQEVPELTEEEKNLMNLLHRK